MARTFNSAPDLLTQSSPAVTDYPVTLSVWFKKTALLANSAPIGLNKVGTSNSSILNYINTSRQSVSLSVNSTGVGAQAVTPINTYSVGVWANSISVYITSADRRIYINGGSTGSDFANIPMSGIDQFFVGSTHDGQIAEAAVWNIALSLAEIASLAAGWSAQHIRPSNLKMYVPLIRDTQNLNSGPMTVVGTTEADHPRIFY